MSAKAEELYVDIRNVVYDAAREGGVCDFILCRCTATDAYGIMATPFNQFAAEPAIKPLAYVGGYCFAKDDKDADKVLEYVVEQVEEYFAKSDRARSASPLDCNSPHN